MFSDVALTRDARSRAREWLLVAYGPLEYPQRTLHLIAERNDIDAPGSQG